MIRYTAAALAFMAGILWANYSQAADIPRSLSGGTVDVKVQAVANPDRLDIKSLSVAISPGGAQVFCKNVADELDPAVVALNAVAGTTDVIPASETVVRLEGYAWSGDDCTGVASTASVDHYTVTFGAPLPPVLIP